MRQPTVCVLEGVTKCPKCEYPRSKIRTPRKDVVHAVIIRYRECLSCGFKYASRTPMTRQELVSAN